VTSFVRWAKARFGRKVLLDVHPLRDRRHNERGRCSVCGADSVFVFNSWVTSQAQRSTWDEPAAWLAHTRRESLFCRSCCSSLRVRGIADVLLSHFGGGRRGFDELVEDPEFRALDVAEINTIGSVGSLHTFLSRLPRLSLSEYRGPDRLGELIDGVRNEDACRLTYEDQSFDLVLSSDTLEHVPDFRLALRETRRILRPGGCHVFTVPVIASRPTTEPRVEVDVGGTLVHLLPPLYHGRGSGLYRYLPVGEDLLTFTDFGRDVPSHMADAGFDPEVVHVGADSDETGAGLVFVGHVPD
jgi:SAM-dependent methyltransferase